MRACPICGEASTIWTIGVENPGDGRPFLRLTEGVDCPECGRVRIVTWRDRTIYWPHCPTCRHDKGVTVIRYKAGGGFIPEAWVCWDCGTRYQRRESGRGGLEILWRPPEAPHSPVFFGVRVAAMKGGAA